MTDLQMRKMRFAFADYDVPFLWNKENPAYSSMTNAASFFSVAFEKMIVNLVREIKPQITDQEVAAEADAFVHQEGQHSTSHRQHVNALIKQHPGLQETLDDIINEFDRLTVNTSVDYRLAYIANLEVSFAPTFKLVLDNDASLFRPGDDRVASLFIWHFVEEIEHRSSALIIFDSVVGSDIYRTRMAPSIFRHVARGFRVIYEGFNKHVPLEERKIDALAISSSYRRKQKLRRWLPLLKAQDNGPMPHAFENLPRREQLIASAGVIRSQLPWYNPAQRKLPALADLWFDRYEAGYDVTHWYTADTTAS
ncbi:metal-dependent hydrolase [Nocardia sp. 004]|uniref:metal-dependent hydrolase n=1 Tax=Nocardia sp. 004 TaxID=3385978 RepID=UPI0039A16436